MYAQGDAAQADYHGDFPNSNADRMMGLTDCQIFHGEDPLPGQISMMAQNLFRSTCSTSSCVQY